MGDFKNKVAEDGYHLRQTEPEYLWQISEEGGICELKKGPGRNMIKNNPPKVLWDYCLELEACIHSNAALDIFELDGMTPKTNISGEKSDITTLC